MDKMNPSVEQKVVSLDIWETLVKIQDTNKRFLTTTLEQYSDYPLERIIKIVKVTGKYCDDLAIAAGHEISSIEKLRLLVANAKARISGEALESLIHEDLRQTPPFIIDPDGLAKLDAHLAGKSLGMILSSNSGFISAAAMRDIISLIGLDELQSYKGAFFSEEIGYAKPSKEFFQYIQGQGYSILMHVGDNPLSDADLSSVDLVGVLFDPANKYPDSTGKRINSISEIAALI